MIPIYVVSLTDAYARRKHIARQMQSAGIEFSFFNAVKGKALSEGEMSELCNMEAVRKHPEWLTPGAIGCSLSHYELYKRIASGSSEWAVIVEDDVIVPSDFDKRLTGIAEKANPEEIIMLYYQSWEPLKLSKHDAVMLTDPEQGLYHPVDVNNVITTGGYLISKKSAALLAENVLPIRVSADSWGYFHKNGWIKGMRCVYPRPLNVAPLKSSIEYFRSPLINAITKMIDRLRIPVLHGWLERRRAAGLKLRQQVELTESAKQWERR